MTDTSSTLPPEGGPARDPLAPSTPSSGTSPVADPTSAPDPAGKPGKAGKADDPLRGSRSSAIYAAVIALGIVLVLLIIFIAQNTERASVRFLGWDGSAPMAVLLLIATAAGLFLSGAAASVRILQLRRRVKRERKR